ncbi:extracellular solute-binding protein [Oricola indica]|uniref:extracellular solute-binding protein n=1 Tax=Oricola indica TaxID=2872591 RepID=UPI003CCBC4C0
MFNYSSFAKTALVATALMTTSVQAQETVVWWDFLGGGDGVRMKQMISDFNAAHEGEITIDATTLEWGVPFYSKVQTSAAVGEAPDIMTYHASRIPLAVDQGILQEITADDWATMGLSEDDYADATWNAVTIDGKQYAVPLDTHPIVLYYNKDVLAEAGLLNDDGTPKGMDSREGFTATLQALKDAGSVKFPLGSVTADGNFMFRTIYSLMGQQDGELMTDGEFLAGDNKEKLQNALGVLAEWTNDGLQSTYTDYPATVALFTSGEAAMMINGVWEVPTMTDLHEQGKLFEWGAVELPVIFDHASTYADSHAFAIPANKGKEMTPEKRAAVLEVMSWISKNSLFWATAGHIPAYGPVTASDEYKAMEPNATYSSLTENMIFDPKTPLAGVAGPIFDVMSTYFVPTLNGEMEPSEAVEEIQYELNDMQ